MSVCVCVCVCIFIKLHITARVGVCFDSIYFLDVRLHLLVYYLDTPAGVTQEEGHIGGRPHRSLFCLFFLILHFSSAVLALIFHREKDSAVPIPRRP